MKSPDPSAPLSCLGAIATIVVACLLVFIAAKMMGL